MRVWGCGACRVAKGWCPCVGTLMCTAQTWKLPRAGALRAPKMLLAHVCACTCPHGQHLHKQLQVLCRWPCLYTCVTVCTLPSSTSTCVYVLVNTWAHTGALQDTPPSPAPHLEVGMVHPAQTLWNWKVPYVPRQAVVVQGAQGSPCLLWDVLVTVSGISCDIHGQLLPGSGHPRVLIPSLSPAGGL